MATNSQPQETPEYRTFRVHYNRLYHAIQDPLSLATQLFAKSIITSAVTGRMIAMGLSTLEKNGVLLSAVEMQIRTDPKKFYEFLSALSEDPSMKSLAKSMQGMVSLRIYGVVNPISMRFTITMFSLKVVWSMSTLTVGTCGL